MGELFGTDGVRGVANVEPMTAETVLEIGRATAYVCKRHGKPHRRRIVIGKDTRLSGYMLETALTAGICSMGVDVLLVGPMPTPGIAFITHNMRADAGMVISASHNPYQDNGIKIFSRAGLKLPDDEQDEIEDLVLSGRIRHVRPTADEIGKATRIDDAAGRYIVFCKNTFPAARSLDRTRIVMDCANGAAYKVAPVVFTELGAEVTPIHCEPDGRNINAACGALHPGDLKRAVRDWGAHVGLAFDGDADRLVAVDECGTELTGDHLLAILARAYKEQGRLRNNLLVTSVMSNHGLRLALADLGIGHVEAPVGDRYVLEAMLAHDAALGGEASGHIICRDHHTTGDGIIAALQVLAAMRESGKPLSDLASVITLTPQRTVNVDVARKPPLTDVRQVLAAMESAERDLDGVGRVLVRYSGTQPLCRIMVEAPTEEMAIRLSEGLAQAVREAIG